jgi:hypothetical protein
MKKIKLIEKIIEDIVIDIRKKLAQMYDITSKEYMDYSGLCNMAYDMIYDKMPYLKRNIDVDIELLRFHGEMRHNPKIKTQDWIDQHTWAGLRYNNVTLYIDPVSQQFKNYFPDIPDYYISYKPPKWYYWDRKNPAWNGVTKRLNEKVRIIHSSKFFDGMGVDRKVESGIIEYCQYEIWGRISQMIRKLSKKE